jgi:hypothetical protein
MARYEPTPADAIGFTTGKIVDVKYSPPTAENTDLMLTLTVEYPDGAPDKQQFTGSLFFNEELMKLSPTERKELVPTGDQWKVAKAVDTNNALDEAASAIGNKFDLTEDGVKGALGATIGFSATVNKKDVKRLRFGTIRYVNGSH